MKPSTRSLLLLSGSFISGRAGSETTNFAALYAVRPRRIAAVRHQHQLEGLTPRVRHRGSSPTNYLHATIGNCPVMVLYNESQQAVNVGLNLLAFPTQTAVFNLAARKRSSLPFNF
jgi:hypothetical protein